MNIKCTALTLSLLVSSVGNFLHASDDCGVINVDVNGKNHKVDCRKIGTGLDAILRYVGLPNWAGAEVQFNGQCVPLEMICKVKVHQCDRLSISTKKS